MPKLKLAVSKCLILFVLGAFTLVFGKISAQTLDDGASGEETMSEQSFPGPDAEPSEAETDYEQQEEPAPRDAFHPSGSPTPDELSIKKRPTPADFSKGSINELLTDAKYSQNDPLKKELPAGPEVSNKYIIKATSPLDKELVDNNQYNKLPRPDESTIGKESQSPDIQIASKPSIKIETRTNTEISAGKPDSELVTLEVKDLDLKDVIKIISRASGLNIIMDNDVKAKITISLKDVTWQTALDNVLKTNELTYKKYDNIVRIMTTGTFTKEQDTMPVTTKIITLNFAKAADLQTSLSKILSARGNIQININTNSLIVTDTPDILAKVEELANKLDVRTPQVIIEALLVSVKLSDTDKSGLDYTITHKDTPKKQLVQTLKPSNSVFDMYYGKTILPLWNISAQLSLFSQDKKVKILANPRILTLDNLPAQIEITEQVPYTFVSQSTDGTSTISTTQFKDIGIKLFVTPHITKDKYISLGVKAEQSFVASFVGATNEPSIDSRKVETNFMLKDSDAVVIGGLKKKDNTTTIDKVPLLGDIPIIGRIFRKHVSEIVNTELLIFISPHIMENSFLSEKEQEKYNESNDDLAGRLSAKEKMALRNKTISDVIDTMDLTPFKQSK